MQQGVKKLQEKRIIMERTIVKPEDIKIPEGMKEALRAVNTVDMDIECAKGYTVSVALAWLANNP